MRYAHLSVGVVGVGAIGARIIEALRGGEILDATLVSVLTRNRQEPRVSGVTVTTELATFLRTKPDVVVEAAGHEAVQALAEPILANGSDVVLLSVGALADPALRERLIDTARAAGRTIIVPSGALGGLDAVGAASCIGLDTVSLVTSKPPSAWIGTAAEGHARDLERLRTRGRIFQGNAQAAASTFTRNANVAAALALAGIGFERTHVELTADPSLAHNVQAVSARGPAGTIEVTLSSIPTAGNPKTGQLVAGSVIRTLKQLTSPIVVGA